MAIIGIDIGGTKIRGILWEGKKVVRSREFATPKNNHDLREKLVALTASLSGQNPVRAIGIGAAGIVDKTTLTFSPNIPFVRDLDFRSLWPRSIPLRLDNDARAFARAEFLRGSGRGAKSLFALTIGTGIGRAYGRNGKIIRLDKFEYPERWEKTYQAIRRKKNDKGLASFLGERLSRLMKPFLPEAIVIGGGVLERRGFLPRLEAAFAIRGLAGKIKRATFRKNGVAIGAALLFDYGRRLP